MILARYQGPAYRAHDPRWAWAPTSGAGAGRHGGRANRRGVDALYLSLHPETALEEYRRLDALLEPTLLVSYRIDVGPLADFRRGYGPGWDPLWQDFHCDWRRLLYNDGIEPPSWVLGDMALAAGAKGILFASVLTGGANLVLYTGALGPDDLLAPHDPGGALPRNQDSWRPRL